jgi:hypothetical protein
MSRKVTVLLLVILWSQPVYAANFFCSAGSITCLFESMLEANFNDEADTIFLDNGVYAGLQLPSVAGPFPLTIVGQEPEGTIIDAADRPLSSVFFIASEGSLTLQDLTVKRGSANGIRNSGTLQLVNTKIDSNRSNGLGSGGGISNSGTASIVGSSVSNNFTLDDAGGGIANSGSMKITNTTVVNNAAGGVFTSGGGIVNIGTLHIVNSTIARNFSFGGELTGGGIHNFGGMLNITNSTISENRAASGGGIANDNDGTAELQNSILARNAIEGRTVITSGGPDCAGILTSLANNLIGDLTECDIDLQGTDLTGEPGLAEYTENPSLAGSGHYPLMVDSRAIDAAGADVCPETDQLGNQRVGICDIGAVEFQGGGTKLVSIDIRPRGEANRIEPNSTKLIRVAILSEFGFDAATVDPNSVRFGATGTEAAPVDFALRDVEADGDRDLVLRFGIQDTGIQCGHTLASLTGVTSSGLLFTGSNSITTVRCRRQR